MEKQTLILIRDFLFKSFIVGILFAILLFVMTTTFWDYASSIIYSKFTVNQKELGELVVDSFIHLRLFLIFIFLVPAISLHWVIKSTFKK
ncbi:MAG: hypothetical protein A3B68_08485 [Candidatus Melainabacteria bacterium RIFCSPHIGHO2_02_FULL_34_12]|nr:MAG: hypothetical protein A3B68_08485 [Candidatus Melainabacteria bacterium RIFCSPHIGHO2_02_FULL_34_12]